MNVVIYSREDMQPITVVDLPQHILKHGAKVGMVRVRVQEPIADALLRTGPCDLRIRALDVDLTFHPMRLFGIESWFITTENDAAAMLLKPDWLPGQRGEVNRLNRERREMAESLMKALIKSLGG